MGKRPICLVCVLLMLALCLADLAGISFIRGNPLSESVQTWIAGHPDAVICGEVQQCVETENSQSVYLKSVYLFYESEEEIYESSEVDDSEKDASEKDDSEENISDKNNSDGNISEKNTSEKNISQKKSFDKNISDTGKRYNRIPIENVRVFFKKKKEKETINIPAGTMLKVSGRLVRVPETRNPGEFDSRQYYACKHIYYFLQDGEILQKSDFYSPYQQGLLDVRECFAEIFRKTAGEDAPVFEAMVLGEKGNLETGTKMRYQMAGIIHILAISGMHISLLGTGLYRLLKKAGLGLFLSGLLALTLVLQYGMLTGGSVAAMRAVCMVLVSVGAELLGRCYDGMTALALSALLLILNAPANLYSSGFLLSFGAVLGISAGQIFCRIAGTKNKIVNALFSSASVQLVTLPVMLYFYGEVSIVGIVLNLAVLPTVGVVLASGVFGGIAGLLNLQLAEVMLIPGRALLFLYDYLCELAGRFPWCTWIGGRPEIWQTGMYYGILLLVLVVGNHAAERMGREEKRKKCGVKSRRSALLSVLLRTVPGCMLPICLGIFILGWHPWNGMKITCLDVGQGDGIVMETSEGYHFLIDSGSSNKSKVGQYQILPFLKSRGISRLDGILVSHTDSDHISGIKELLELSGDHLTGIRVDKIILPEWTEKGEAYMELEALAEKADAEVVQGSRGDVFEAGKLKILFLAPSESAAAAGLDVNEDSMVFEVQYEGFRGLFTGDIGEETEKKLLPYFSDVDFLKVAHHGSRYSTGEEFLKKVMPEVGVISCSASNTYGHPHKETLERLEKAGVKVLRTDESGAVEIKMEGEKIVVSGHVREKSRTSPVER